MTPPFLVSPPGDEPVEVEGFFGASASRLFQAWTDPDEVLKWFGPGETPLASVRIDLRAGGSWEFAYAEGDTYKDVLRGEYIEVTPNKSLVFTWIHERTQNTGEIETTAPSQVSLSFEELRSGVRLRLTHKRIVTEGGRLGVSRGWSMSFEKLSDMFPTG